jgi:hypothetical protein
MVPLYFLAFFVVFFIALFVIVGGILYYGERERRTRPVLPTPNKSSAVALHSAD